MRDFFTGLHSDEFARGVIEPLLRQQFFRQPVTLATREGEIIHETSNDSDDVNVSAQADSPFRLPVAEQAQVATTLGDLMIRLNRLDDALRYLRVAQKLETGPALRNKISSTITDVSTRLRRQQLNAARQPILHEAVEQDRLVRPRLLARVAPPAKACRVGRPAGNGAKPDRTWWIGPVDSGQARMRSHDGRRSVRSRGPYTCRWAPYARTHEPGQGQLP